MGGVPDLLICLVRWGETCFFLTSRGSLLHNSAPEADMGVSITGQLIPRCFSSGDTNEPNKSPGTLKGCRADRRRYLHLHASTGQYLCRCGPGSNIGGDCAIRPQLRTSFSAWYGPRTTSIGVSWGVPWQQGAVGRNATFSLSAQGKELPVQTWPWPTGPTAPSNGPALPRWRRPEFREPFYCPRARLLHGALALKRRASRSWSIPARSNAPSPSSGPNIIDSMIMGGKHGRRQPARVHSANGPETNPEDSPARERYISHVKHVTVEQSGPVRAVVKSKGCIAERCRSANGCRLR